MATFKAHLFAEVSIPEMGEIDKPYSLLSKSYLTPWVRCVIMKPAGGLGGIRPSHGIVQRAHLVKAALDGRFWFR